VARKGYNSLPISRSKKALRRFKPPFSLPVYNSPSSEGESYTPKECMSKSNPNHKRFFASFFKDTEGYAEIEANGWWLIRHWDGNANAFTIDVYSEESYRNYVRGKSQWKEQQEDMDFLKSI
jgi:hypothetical protein